MSPAFARGSEKWLAGTTAALAAGLFLFFQLEPSIIEYFFFSLFFLGVAMVFWFFRDPEREIAKGIAAPADGLVTEVSKEFQDEDVGGLTVKVVTFMNVHNVHVNRAPLEGTVVSLTHIPGSHIPAWDKDSDRNERVVTILETAIGKVKLVQIAGTVARRIVPYVKKGDRLEKGERYGIILFGSRVDTYLPAGEVTLTVKKGDKPRAGSFSFGETAFNTSPGKKA